MSYLRLLIIAVATICILALGAFAFATTSDGGDDDIIIKGGSIEIQCGKNHKKDCLGAPDVKTGKYKRKDYDDKHIMKVVVKDSYGTELSNANFDKDHQPTVVISYK